MTKLRIIVPKDLRNQVFIRDKNKCLRCGSEERLEIHHIDENPANNSINNLIILCRTCHRPFHTHLCTKYYSISEEGDKYLDYVLDLLKDDEVIQELKSKIYIREKK